MGRAHDHFEEMAVTHALGGLAPSDEALFRSHLAACADCRARVAELQDIADALADAEQEALTGRQVAEDVRRRPAGRDGSRRLGVAATVIAVAVGIVLAGLSFWNLHLRDSNRRLARVVEDQEDVLALLAAGTPVELHTETGISGVAARDASRLALDLSGLPPLARGERLVVRLVGTSDDPDAANVAIFAPEDLQAGRLPLVFDHRGAETVEVARVSTDSGSQTVLVRGELDEPDAGDAG